METFRKIEGSGALMVINRRTGEKFCIESISETSVDAVKIIDALLQNPDILIDAVTNEMTDYDAEELVNVAMKQLNT
jgi:hypothetical protein